MSAVAFEGFAHFEQVGVVDGSTLEMLENVPVFPREILGLWRRYGTGFIGADGFVRLVDPSHYGAYMSEWFSDAQGSVPFLATGMGDLLVWHQGVIRQVFYRYGRIENINPVYDTLFAFLENEAYVRDYWHPGLYEAGVEKLGRPELYEAFFFAPFLALGGPERIEHLQRGDLSTSLTIFTQMMGKASLIPGNPPSQG